MRIEQKEHYDIYDLLAIMRLLRAPDGCPWDQQQTHQSIRSNFLEETCEAMEAIDLGDMALLREELGDVLFQVVFHAEMERERGTFDFDDVCDGICKKLIFRHPHVFSDAIAQTPEDVLRNWDLIKKQEKGQTTQTQAMQSVSRTLPALMRSEKVQKRAARVGFDYPCIEDAFQDLRNEVDELSDAIRGGQPGHIREELGDVLFSVANVARFADVDSEEALGASCDKFIRRFSQVESLAAAQGLDMQAADLDALNGLWREAKKKRKSSKSLMEGSTHDEG